MTKSTLSFKKIAVTVFMFLAIFVLYYPINYLLQDQTITYTVLINIIGCLMFIYNFELIALHYNRVKKNFNESLIYFAIGCLYFTILILVNAFFLHGSFPVLDSETAHHYYISIPNMLFAHSIILIMEMNLFYKVLTDHLSVKEKELPVIIISGILFGILFTALFVPFDQTQWIHSAIFYALMMSFQSYSYNQSGSLIPGTLSLSLILFVYNLLLIM